MKEVIFLTFLTPIKTDESKKSKLVPGEIILQDDDLSWDDAGHTVDDWVTIVISEDDEHFMNELELFECPNKGFASSSLICEGGYFPNLTNLRRVN